MAAEHKGKYQPWSHEEFIADIRVRRMTSSARKIYMVLLHEAFVCSTRPDLPDDEEGLSLMADCDNPAEWEASRQAVLNMFERGLVDGAPVLFQKRLREDWAKLQEIRANRAEAGRRGGLAKAGICLAKSSMEVKEVSKGSEEKGSEGKESPDPDLENPLIGQEDDVNLKPLKAQAIAVGAKHGFKISGYPEMWEELMAIVKASSPQEVLEDLDSFLTDNEGETFLHGALSKYLQYAAERLMGGSPALSKVQSPELTALSRELTYLSNGIIAFSDKHKVKLAELLNTWEKEEIIAVFKEWLTDQDLDDSKNLQYLPIRFVQTADSRCYTLRRSREEKVSEGLARQKAVERLQEAANAERQEAEKKRQAEEENMGPLADLMS